LYHKSKVDAKKFFRQRAQSAQSDGVLEEAEEDFAKSGK
jgi:hypothetical protein